MLLSNIIMVFVTNALIEHGNKKKSGEHDLGTSSPCREKEGIVVGELVSVAKIGVSLMLRAPRSG